ncbi:hypothetical protein GCM10010233_61710 [Streptomyces pseudogriseolus]|nr:hypothetical protein GCM10010233_61710 [Streptomyces gancidicus]
MRTGGGNGRRRPSPGKGASCGAAQPFTAPVVMPETTDRRKISTRSAIGTVATIAPAKITP